MHRDSIDEKQPDTYSRNNSKLVSLDDLRHFASKRNPSEQHSMVDMGEFNIHLQIDDSSTRKPLTIDETAQLSLSKEQAKHLNCGDIQELFRRCLDPIQSSIDSWLKNSAPPEASHATGGGSKDSSQDSQATEHPHHDESPRHGQTEGHSGDHRHLAGTDSSNSDANHNGSAHDSKKTHQSRPEHPHAHTEDHQSKHHQQPERQQHQQSGHQRDESKPPRGEARDTRGGDAKPSRTRSDHSSHDSAPSRTGNDHSIHDSAPSHSGSDQPSRSTNVSLVSERSRLRAEALSRIPDINNNIGQNRRDFFESNMQKFEQRAREVGLSDSEVANTYKQVERLLTARDSAHARPQNERTRIAEQLMYHAANPANIDQGHLTCNVTTVEDRMFRTKPSAAAEVIATTALTGQWVAPDGKVIRIDPRSLEPNRDERLDVPADNKRSEASKMFQIAALNDVGQRFAHPLYFQQRATGSERETGGYWGDEHGRFAKEFVGVNSQGITQESQRLSGDHDPFVMMNSRVRRDHSGLITFSSASQLGQQLQHTDFEHKPAVLVVNAYDPVFTKHNPQIGVQVNHVVSIVDYNAATHRAQIDDQHGKRRDQWVNLSDLYRATT